MCKLSETGNEKALRETQTLCDSIDAQSPRRL